MTRMIHCAKLQTELEGLDRPPYPGELGQKIYENISKTAWNMWIGHQTMLINEYRLSMIDPTARDFLRKEMEKYFFGDGSDAPPDYTPE